MVSRFKAESMFVSRRNVACRIVSSLLSACESRLSSRDYGQETNKRKRERGRAEDRGWKFRELGYLWCAGKKGIAFILADWISRKSRRSR